MIKQTLFVWYEKSTIIIRSVFFLWLGREKIREKEKEKSSRLR